MTHVVSFNSCCEYISVPPQALPPSPPSIEGDRDSVFRTNLLVTLRVSLCQPSIEGGEGGRCLSFWSSHGVVLSCSDRLTP